MGLPDEPGADYDAVPLYQTAVDLSREERPGEAGQRQREDNSGQHREQEDTQDGRPELLAPGRDGCGRWRSTILKVRRLIANVH